ncbi:MAG: OPT/YSL family transporter, partial [Myxococcota bacterium]|nr:OPT/YSL family transporter [Myxococcota bacterium]
QDLKAGHILGATPWKQQVMQVLGVVSAAVVLAPVLMLLHEAFGFVGAAGPEHTEPLAAPQAGLMASVAQGVFDQNLPWGMIQIGAVIAVLIIAVDEWLKKRGSSWRTPVLAVAVGIYLPFELSVPLLIGGVLGHFADRKTNHDAEAGHGGLLVASGYITGEALTGIGLALVIWLTGRRDVMHVMDEPLGSWPGILLLGGFAYGLYRVATRMGSGAEQPEEVSD